MHIIHIYKQINSDTNTSIGMMKAVDHTDRTKRYKPVPLRPVKCGRRSRFHDATPTPFPSLDSDTLDDSDQIIDIEDAHQPVLAMNTPPPINFRSISVDPVPCTPINVTHKDYTTENFTNCWQLAHEVMDFIDRPCLINAESTFSIVVDRLAEADAKMNSSPDVTVKTYSGVPWLKRIRPSGVTTSISNTEGSPSGSIRPAKTGCWVCDVPSQYFPPHVREDIKQSATHATVMALWDRHATFNIQGCKGCEDHGISVLHGMWGCIQYYWAAWNPDIPSWKVIDNIMYRMDTGEQIDADDLDDKADDPGAGDSDETVEYRDSP